MPAAGRRLIAAADCSAPQRVHMVDGCVIHETDGERPTRLVDHVDPATERIVTAALAAAMACGLPAESIARGIRDESGIGRRP